MAKNGRKYEYPLMKPREFEAARAHFGLPNTRFSRMIGVKWRQGQRYSDGDTPVPETTAKFIRTLIKHDLTAEDIG